MTSSVPERTCIGCGAKAAQPLLVRLVARDGRVEVDRRGGGRGAWIHARGACVERAARRRAFGRALRAPGLDLDEASRLLLTGSGRND